MITRWHNHNLAAATDKKDVMHQLSSAVPVFGNQAARLPSHADWLASAIIVFHSILSYTLIYKAYDDLY
jgi:hypothetical protein